MGRTNRTLQVVIVRYRILSLIGMCSSAAVGLLLKYYQGPGQDWINDWGPASVAYEFFFVFVGFYCVPRREKIYIIAIIVCLGTCVLEFAQLWQALWLEAIRSTWLGKLLLGTSFAWWDFPAYLVGCCLGAMALRKITLSEITRVGRDDS